MTPYAISSYFRELIDEPDFTFVTTTNVGTYLDIAYGQFRREVSNVDPMIYAKSVEFTSPGKTIDLTSITDTDGAAVNVLGNSVTEGNRMIQLISLESVSSAGDVRHEFQPVNNASALNYTQFAYTWRGQTIQFSGSVTDTVRLRYLPEHAVPDWTGNVNQLDDLTMFHDVIALLAYSQYAMRDGAENPALIRQLNQRVAALREYVGSRTLESASYVQTVGWDDYGWL